MILRMLDFHVNFSSQSACFCSLASFAFGRGILVANSLTLIQDLCPCLCACALIIANATLVLASHIVLF